MVTFTVDKYGRPGMPTFNVKKVRKLLKSGKAEIFCYHPFTIKLMYADSLKTQPVEICLDTGDRHIGVSVKSEKHEFVHAQYDPLPDEKERRDDRRRYRRTRRNRKRYRKPRFDNRRRDKGWLAPTVEHKKDLHVSIVERYMKVCPIVRIIAEVGTFDTQLLEAAESGKPLPKGTDYQHGKRYLRNTLRDAVFYRDGYKCLLCGSTEGPFAVHHIGYWKGDHTDRMGGLVTLCLKCHTASNHQKDGPLWGWAPKIRPMTGAAFMNTVRWRIVEDLEEEPPRELTADELFLQRTRQMVLDHLEDDDYDRDALASDMGASASTLYNKLRAIANVNVSTFIRSIRMDEAKRIATETPDIRISDLAYRVGFRDPRYFSTTFKKHFGMQPTEFLDSLKKKS